MIRIITGAQNSSKQAKFFEYLKSEADKSKVLVIVPEQFTFEYEKNLYKLLGPKEYNKLSVLSFKRLGTFLAQKYAVSIGNSDNDNIRMLAMYCAVSKLRNQKQLSHFGDACKKVSFINDCLEVIEQLRHNSIEPEKMNNAIKLYQSDDESFAHNASSEISEIYLEYDNQLRLMGVCDSLSLPKLACSIINEQNAYVGYHIYIDEFSGFTEDEFDVIRALVKNSDITISLTMQKNSSRLSPTAICTSVQEKLIEAAKEHNLPVEFDVCDDYSLCTSEAINHINKYLYTLSSKKISSDGNVRIINAIDRYKEIEVCACQISHLVLEEGYKYDDIAVISNNLSDYDRICESVFYRYDIPYFTDYKKSAAQSAIALHIVNVLEAVSTRKFNTGKILKYIKSPISNITDIEKTIIEEYCISWGVDKDVWLEDFTGYVNSFGVDEEKKKEELEKVNSIRRKIIEPLYALKKQCSDKSVKSMCKALFEFFEKTELSKQIYSNTLNLVDENNENLVEVSRNIKQIWLSVCETIRNIYDYCLVDKITVDEFSGVIKLLLSQLNMASAPQKLDSVILADAKRSRIGSKKVVFVLGVNEGVFPSNPQTSKLLNRNILSYMKKSGIEISDDQMYSLLSERYSVYSALTAATQRLYISFPTYNNSGEILHPSEITKMILNMIDGLIVESANSISLIWFCTNLKSAYYKYIECYSENSVEHNTIRKLLLENEEYARKIEYIEMSGSDKRDKLSPQISRKLFLRGDESSIITSASSIEKFFTCPYAYFFNKGIKLRKPKKYELDALNIGSLLHYCLEQIMSKEESGVRVYNPDFSKYDEDVLKTKISEIFIEYKEKGFGGDFSKTRLFDFKYDILEEYTFYIVRNLQLELENSKFVPEYFEKSLNNNDGSFLFEKMFSDVLLRLSGSVDRIDIARNGAQKLLRVVDYKSGKKKFSPADVMYGLNMQMLLYLVAVINDEKLKSGVDAGVLYQRIEPPYEFVERENNSDIAKQKKDREQLRAFGIGVDEYVSCDIQGDVSLISYTTDEFDALKRVVNSKLEEFLDALKTGNIAPAPTMGKDSKESACEFCDYWSVCSAYNKVECKIVSKNDVEEFEEMISKMTGGAENDKLD